MWWAALQDVRPAHVKLLNETERGRRDRYLRDADRDRFTLGVAITRLAAGALLGLAPEAVPVTRACPDCDRPHGRPAIEGGPDLSVSHSGDRVGVALAGSGPVGLDVEADNRRLETDISGHVLAPDEHLPAGMDQRTALLTYWTRKEAVLKATGDGLRAPLTGVHLSPPDQPPRLLAWDLHPDLVPRFTLHPLNPGPGHLACLALIDQPEAALQERPATALLH